MSAPTFGDPSDVGRPAVALAASRRASSGVAPRRVSVARAASMSVGASGISCSLGARRITMSTAAMASSKASSRAGASRAAPLGSPRSPRCDVPRAPRCQPAGWPGRAQMASPRWSDASSRARASPARPASWAQRAARPASGRLIGREEAGPVRGLEAQLRRPGQITGDQGGPCPGPGQVRGVLRVALHPGQQGLGRVQVWTRVVAGEDAQDAPDHVELQVEAAGDLPAAATRRGGRVPRPTHRRAGRSWPRCRPS